MRLTVELDVEVDEIEYPDLDEKQVLDGIFIHDDDVVDGFLVSTDIAGYDNACDFFLRNGRITKKERISENMDIILENEERMDMCL